MYVCLWALVCSLLTFVSPLFATTSDTAISVPDLGIDWAGTVTALTTLIAAVIVASLGLWAAIKVVRAAKRWVGGAVSGR